MHTETPTQQGKNSQKIAQNLRAIEARGSHTGLLSNYAREETR